MPRIVSKKRTFFPDKNREQADIKKPQQYETDVQALRDNQSTYAGLGWREMRSM